MWLNRKKDLRIKFKNKQTKYSKIIRNQFSNASVTGKNNYFT